MQLALKILLVVMAVAVTGCLIAMSWTSGATRHHIEDTGWVAFFVGCIAWAVIDAGDDE